MRRSRSRSRRFAYDLSPHADRLSSDRILAALRRFSRSLRARPFAAREFDLWRRRPCTSRTVVARFGSWQAALTRAGLPCLRTTRYTVDQLLDNLDRVWRAVGRRPGIRTLRRRGRITAYPYRARWGSLARACQILADYRAGRLSREDLLQSAARPRRSGISLSTRWRIMQRDRFKCVVCGASPATDPTVQLNVDHIDPFAQGGGDHDQNLRTTCQQCNLGRRGHPDPGPHGCAGDHECHG